MTFVLLAAASAAGELNASVVDRAGRGVSEVIVTLEPLLAVAAESADKRGVPSEPSAPSSAIMDQRNRAFVPHVLVVAVGTSVEFPNNDTVSHQVYSFSAAKKFQLPLYKGEHHSPVVFDRPGLVVLGCNIHDEMAGYIFVTETPFFGKTDASGALSLHDVPQGDYRMTIWSPFIADPPQDLVRTIHVGVRPGVAERVQLVRDLRSRPEPRPRRGNWDY